MGAHRLQEIVSRLTWLRGLTEPSASVSDLSERRQARLLSAFLLTALTLGVLSEISVAVVYGGVPFAAYPETIPLYLALAALYRLSRTRHYRWAVLLTVVAASVGVFSSALSHPQSIANGFLDYLVVTILFASLFFRPRVVLTLLGALLLAVLAVPLAAPSISLSTLVTGPVTFLLGAGLLIIVIARHRDRLEQDRQAELRENEERYRTLVEQLPAIVYLDEVDPNSPNGYKSLYASPQFESLLGYSRAEYQADQDLWEKLIHPDDRARVLAEDRTHYTSGQPTAQEYRLVAKDGHIVWVRDEARIRWDPDRKRQLSQGILLDITSRMLAEERSRRDAARAEALLRVARRLNAQLDLPALLETICEEMTRALERTVGVVYLLDDRPGVLRPAAAVGLPPEARETAFTLAREQFMRLVAERGPVVVVGEVRAEPDWPNPEAYAALGARGLALAPMIYEGTLIGSLSVLTEAAHPPLTEEARLLLEGLAAQAALAIVNTRVYKDARRRLEQLEALRAVDLAITGSTDLRVTLDVLLREIARQLNVDAALVLLLDGQRHTLDYAASRGFRTPTLRYTRLRLGEGNAGRAALARQIVAIPNIAEAPGTFTNAPAFRQEGFQAYYAAPLLAKGEVKGVLELFHRARLDPDAEWLSFLETLAGQAALAIDNAGLFQGLQRSNAELSLAYDATIVGWSRALDLRDKETEGHTQRVTEMTLRLAAKMNVSEVELVHMRRGALLHDIGKMGIPDSILLKPGPLTDEEWAIMRRHPSYAHELLAPIAYLASALDIPYCHHEKWDGSGYPRGLRGEAIPLPARLFAVVDVWDALCSDRPYRKGWARASVLAHIQQGAGTHFDPHVVEAFLALMAEQPEAVVATPAG